MMFNKEKIKPILKISIIFMVALLICYFIPVTMSRYQSDVGGTGTIDYAAYILEAGYTTIQVKLEELVPRDEVYTYTFTVSNFNDTEMLETDMEYTISLLTTTNLPLEYEIYMNEVHTDTGATSDFISDVTEPDEYGTYFRTMTMEKSYFSFTTQETNTYELVVSFPARYNSSTYQYLVELITINIDSKQIME